MNLSEINKKAIKLKLQKSLVQAYLQYCALLSSQGKFNLQIINQNSHKKALQYAKNTALELGQIFLSLYQFGKEIKNTHKNSNRPNTFRNQSTKKIIKQTKITTNTIPESEEPSSQFSQLNIEISFNKVVIDFALPILKGLVELSKPLNPSSIEFQSLFQEIQNKFYFWKQNPENNAKHLKQGLKLEDLKINQTGRSLLGVEQPNDWLDNFNIGTIMHLNPIVYEEFAFYGDLVYEMSKKMLLEKVPICFLNYFQDHFLIYLLFYNCN